MVNSKTADKFAIGLSTICAAHCLAFPFIITLLPGFTILGLGGEIFHIWMLVLVIPTSLIALLFGCRKHRRFPLFILGTLGVTFLVVAVTIAETLLGDMGETVFTLIGAAILIGVHIWNYRLCKGHDEPDVQN